MKFGLEAEKFIFNMEKNIPSKGVFSFIDALSDFRSFQSDRRPLENKISNEFVLNMVEFSTTPSSSPMEVLKDYLLNYLMVQSIAAREHVGLVPMGSLPMDFLPQMTPKWAYYVQNSVLAGRKQKKWTMEKNSPLRSAGNCAGIHVHIELETKPEFLFSNNELKNKFNLALMLSPLVAFSSSPYFFRRHKASSMRGQSYYQGVYKNFPLHGALPNVMESSVEVLNYVQASFKNWKKLATDIGFKDEEVDFLLSKKSANWNPVRWNAQWNTIECRFLDSDSIEMDAAKFVWICTSMNRVDLKGEALETETLKTKKKLDKGMISESLKTNGRNLSILPTSAIHDLFHRAVQSGTRDPLVELYLNHLQDFCEASLDPDHKWLFRILKRALAGHLSTTELILKETKSRSIITNQTATALVLGAIERQDKIEATLKKYLPEVFQHLEKAGPQFGSIGRKSSKRRPKA